MMSSKNKVTTSSFKSNIRLINQVQDPPGQRSVYIPPGDPDQEIYRLATFKDFPTTVPISTRKFAGCGFYYTGFKDRVKCFSCGQAAENWLKEDDFKSVNLHKPSCDFANGRDQKNVPIHGNFKNLMFLGKTVSDPSAPLVHGKGTSSISTAACRSGSGTSRGNITLQLSTPSPKQQPSLLLRDEINKFPCLHPVTPNMRDHYVRLQTFFNGSAPWPTDNIRPMPQDISQAGFFFLGIEDQVKCWYCNGGIQNWCLDDIPWVEHAKWFPMCEFLLREKGPQFVHSVLAQHSDLRRPPMQTAPGRMNVIPQRQAQKSNTRHFSVAEPLLPSSPVIKRAVTNGSQRDPRRFEKQVDKETKSLLFEQAAAMGFIHTDIKAAFYRQYERSGKGFSSLGSLLDSLISNQESDNNSTTQVEVPTSVYQT